MTSNGGSNREEDGAFAQAVIALFKENIGQRTNQGHRNNKYSQDAVGCANGLALIQQLLTRHLRELRAVRLREVAADPLAFNETVAAAGIAEAFAIVEHLTTGRDHPIAQHIRGVHFAALRPQRARVNDFALLCQRVAVGAALAIEAGEGVSFRRAATKLADVRPRSRSALSQLSRLSARGVASSTRAPTRAPKRSAPISRSASQCCAKPILPKFRRSPSARACSRN